MDLKKENLLGSFFFLLVCQFSNVVWPSLGAPSFDLLQKPENPSVID